MAFDIFVQVLGLVPSVICFTSLQSGSRKRILMLQVVCALMWLTHYGLLGAYTGMVVNGVNIARAGLCYYNDRAWARSKAWLFGLIACYIASSALTWAGWVSVLPCVSMTLTTVALWTHDMRKTRALFLFNSPPLAVYNFLIGSWTCFAVELCALVSFIIAVWRFDLRPRLRKNCTDR